MALAHLASDRIGVSRSRRTWQLVRVGLHDTHTLPDPAGSSSDMTSIRSLRRRQLSRTSRTAWRPPRSIPSLVAVPHIPSFPPCPSPLRLPSRAPAPLSADAGSFSPTRSAASAAGAPPSPVPRTHRVRVAHSRARAGLRGASYTAACDWHAGDRSPPRVSSSGLRSPLSAFSSCVSSRASFWHLGPPLCAR